MAEPPTTEDGHHVVVNGRKWRATDPSIPADRRAELTRILMSWRREVRRTKGTDQERAARAGVQAAKVALGERGTPPWWEQTDEQRRARWQADVPAPGGPLPPEAPVREHRGDHPHPGNGERTEHA
ncbi:hypothetical protein BST34_01485 [Mycolicibacterium monacense DSM 44395]|uniref:Biopolymer transporter Tol n=1 Tax=Mycolicibacterium monacense TaxID=85693 RepID=A0AAD1IY51_MYCMB|nr:hypothetical protein [Mycolicibacterium monacense DSM 44395]ORB24660.1 hypothetical protein BST34_01485 [Mycolicibacterium monacense DSM 44395]QHP84185.1 hypothetical protein EWR22_01730 [Mycolicibacterium monacense DSM 44395]BBZ63086.1 hypothetical protein MMON_43870 [Mycolicibacterium monacense]